MRDVTGFRGEKIVELCLTDYSVFKAQLFRPAFLGDKWPAIDFYVELNGVRGKRPYFLIQCKTAGSRSQIRGNRLKISTTKRDILRLLQIPRPTYILGVHEQSRRVFVKSVHRGIAPKAISGIELSHELTSPNLRKSFAAAFVEELAIVRCR